ncbi:MAG TPA: hypothetical protein VHD15_15590 [Hyphomicrobiales bacterium]|nr:hypothetical protein [Hyphomicrobiales bacterium]
MHTLDNDSPLTAGELAEEYVDRLVRGWLDAGLNLGPLGFAMMTCGASAIQAAAGRDAVAALADSIKRTAQTQPVDLTTAPAADIASAAGAITH